MKINVKIKNDFTSRVPVWFGKIVNGMVIKNSQIDFEQSRRRTALKKYLRDQEDLERHLNKWAREAGF
jgi:hypothetical protein